MYLGRHTDLLCKTGYGQHGDYLFGWKDDGLQRGMDALKSAGCAIDKCSALKVQTGRNAIACTKPQVVVEDVSLNGCKWTTPPNPSSRATLADILVIRLKELPGSVQVTYA